MTMKPYTQPGDEEDSRMPSVYIYIARRQKLIIFFAYDEKPLLTYEKPIVFLLSSLYLPHMA